MGWFGSLQLAYKYAIVLGSLFALVILLGICKVIYNKRQLKKHITRANLESAGKEEERVELNQREPDEGDLFGIRAIQSGYFGGVAQSRPTSVAGSTSPDGSASNTLLGSHPSPKVGSHSPMSSVTTLPLEPRRSSPLAHKAISAEDLDVPSTPKRKAPTPLKSTLQPSDAELFGRVNHDPAVNMFLEIPPSPVAASRPTTAYSDTNDRTPSDYFNTPHNGGQYAPVGAPQLPIPDEVKRMSARRPISALESNHPEQGHHSQSASIVSGISDGSTQDSHRSPSHINQSFVRAPPKTAQEDRPRSRGREERPRSIARPHPPRSSSMVGGFPESPTIRPIADQDEGSVPKPPRIPSAVGDWGSDIFQEIDQGLQDSKSMNNSDPNEKYSHHASKLSDASSTYSTAQFGHRGSGRQISIDSRIQARLSGGPDIVLSSDDTNASPNGTRRLSDASSREASSANQSAAGSHRNTRELGDFYDSYLRYSGQGQSTNPQNAASGRSGDMSRDIRRPPQMDLKPETITEVPSPLASPLIGKAM